MRTALFFHVVDNVPPLREGDDYVGSPMYEIIPDHELAIASVVALFAGAFLLRFAARRWNWAQSLIDGYRSLTSIHKLLAWLLAVSGIVHLALAFGHEPYFMTPLWLIGGVAPFWVLRRLMVGKRWRRWAALVMLGSIIGYMVSSISGEAPDQVGIATKLVELLALGIVLTPRDQAKRLRRFASSAATVTLVVATAVSVWIGAFVAGDGGHHLGEVPTPGVLIPALEDREPTAHEYEEAEQLYYATVAGIEKFEDVGVARAAGYDVDGMFGTDWHASNSAYQGDGRILDPTRPETLVYAMNDGEAVLLGALYEMPDIGEAGPAVGGPITVWHAHDHICFSLTPPALAGLQSPFGGCPFGSLSIGHSHRVR